MGDDSNSPSKDGRTDLRQVMPLSVKLDKRLETTFARRNSGLGEIRMPLLEQLGLRLRASKSLRTKL